MSDSARADRAVAIIAAAGHDLNDNLMVAAGEIYAALEKQTADNPLRPYLVDACAAVDRACAIATLLVTWAARAGAKTPKASLEYLVDDGTR